MSYTDDDSDGDENEKKKQDLDKDIRHDCSILNVEQRIKMDEELKDKYVKMEVDIEKTQETVTFKRNLIDNIEKALSHRNNPSHNRLVCIVDRRHKYYDFKMTESQDEIDQFVGDNHEKAPYIKIDADKLKKKKDDRFFIF